MAQQKTSSKQAHAQHIAIVTPDVIGPTRNGGIGTAYYHLALHLVKQGHQVTILYTLGDYTDNDSKTLKQWTAWYADQSIAFLPLALPKTVSKAAQKTALHLPFFRSLYAYEWLAAEKFDVIHFPDWQGGAYHSTLNKQLGNAFKNTTLIIGLHSPTYWHHLHDESLNKHQSLEDQSVNWLEKGALAMCDLIVSPSQYLLSWCQQQQWQLCPNACIIHNVYPVQAQKPPPQSPLEEIVFFGRLETRKGIKLFCEALPLIAPKVREKLRFTFLGKSSLIDGQPSEKIIKKLLATHKIPYKIIDDLQSHDAIAYLKGKGRLAVIASLVENSPYVVLECLSEQIPFITTHSGGTPELIAAEDHPTHSFEVTPQALAQQITSLAGQTLSPARLATSLEDTLIAWQELHEQLQQQSQAFTHKLTAKQREAALLESMQLLTLCHQSHQQQQVIIAKLEGDKMHQKSIIHQHNQTIAKAQQQTLDFKHKLAFQTQENEALQEQQTALRDEEVNLRQAIANYQQDLKTLQQAYDNILNSSSWKVTKPLRKVSGKLKKDE